MKYLGKIVTIKKTLKKIFLVLNFLSSTQVQDGSFKWEKSYRKILKSKAFMGWFIYFKISGVSIWSIPVIRGNPSIYRDEIFHGNFPKLLDKLNHAINGVS